MRLFTRDKDFYSTLVKLAVPIALQNLITFSVALADNIMVGKLGEYAIGGVYLGNQLQTLLQFLVTGFESAMLILTTQYWGKKDTESIRRIISIALQFCMAMGILFTILVAAVPEPILRLFTNDTRVIHEALIYVRVLCWSYVFFCISQILICAMRSVEQAKVGFYISIFVLFFNVFLNYTLIYGHFGFHPMGVRGAAIATLVSRIFEMAAIVIYMEVIDQKLKLRIKDYLIYDKTFARDMLHYGTPVIMGQVVWAVNNLAQSAIIGHMSAEAIAAVSIAGMLSNLLFMGVIGLSVALGIITGKTIGQGEYEKMKEYAVTAQVIFALLGLLSGVIILAFMNPFIRIYNINQATVTVARQFMIILAIATIGRCYQATCLAGLVKAGGDVGFVFINDTIFVFGVVLPSALIAMFLFHAPSWVVYICLQSDQILKCFVAFIKINRFHWMKNLTHPDAGC